MVLGKERSRRLEYIFCVYFRTHVKVDNSYTQRTADVPKCMALGEAIFIAPDAVAISRVGCKADDKDGRCQ